MTRVLSVTSECAPLVKTGGLADVAGALPAALKPHGIEMRTLVPGYPVIMAGLVDAEIVATLPNFFGGDAKILSATSDGLDLLVLDAPHLYDRGAGIYLNETGTDWADNPQRFAALSKAASEITAGLLADWQPEVVHCHDWQAALAPYYISRADIPVRTVLTIHNIAFQGIAPAHMLGELDILPEDFRSEGVEYWGNISALKAGIMFADKITTVSPTYADELKTEEFGMGLEGVMKHRQADFSGILNGIDTETWNPATDASIKSYKTLAGKKANKAALLREFGLGQASGPLCAVVSRLTDQKGLDLLLEALPRLLDRDGQFILLGSGDPKLEAAFIKAAKHPNVGIHIGYDEELSHRIIAGSDAIVVPSRFEPCGLTQLYGLRYGTVPLVALTGGLADTVISANAAAVARQVATGIQFYPITANALSNALNNLCDLFAQPRLWSKMQRNAMAQPVGWDTSSSAYAALYQELVSKQ